MGLVCDPCLQLGVDVRRHITQANGEMVVGTVGGGARSVFVRAPIAHHRVLAGSRGVGEDWAGVWEAAHVGVLTV